MITPEEVAAKAEKVYKKFLSLWITGEDDGFFAYRLLGRTNQGLKLDRDDVSSTIAAVAKLWSKSKQERGWGYTVHREQIRLRDFGNNLVPVAITIDTLDDLLRLTRRQTHFEATCQVASQLRKSLPGLSDWVVKHIGKLAELQDALRGLIAVTEFFVQNPWPDCYARQIPVAVDTKFVQRHQATLRQWLDILLPASAIDVNETRFEHRFGLRDSQRHRALRILDQHLLAELGLPFDELSLPLKWMAQLPVRDITVVIVENDPNLLTLPPLGRGIGLRGEGKAVTRLGKLPWLDDCRIVYWGDVDVDGFQILSSLRNLISQVTSIMMDRATWDEHIEFVGAGNGSTPPQPTNLTAGEAAMFQQCLENNQRLEQEKILQSYVDAVFASHFH